jgi:hypothetical protein
MAAGRLVHFDMGFPHRSMTTVGCSGADLPPHLQGDTSARGDELMGEQGRSSEGDFSENLTI